MEIANVNVKSRLWWLILVLGVLMVIGGFAYWIWPVAGFAVASTLFGWLLILAAVVQIIVGVGPDKPRYWGWWIVGGVIDMFIGFMLVRSLPLAEAVFPYFMAILFIYWGLEALVSSTVAGRKYWWLSVINGILLCIIGYFFVEGGIANTIFMSTFIVAIAFIYWGFTLCMLGYELK